MSGQGKYDTSVCGQESWYLYWLAGVPGIGMRTMQKLMGHFGRASRVYQASCEELQQVSGITPSLIEQITSREGRDQSRQSWSALSQRGIRYVSFYGDDYPERLQKIFDPPVHLYVRGGLPDPSRRSIGIVGARNCTLYGRDMARLFGYRLAGAGGQVSSGMAKGVDGWAHQGALESGGDTFAVLGCGVDVCYPAIHCRLYESIRLRGGILSELPVGTKARPGFFPMRNRIISALSDGILVVEARERSGSLITADAALDQGKDVFVIPGRIGDELSVGCNRLIRQGAVPVLSPSDILEYYGLAQTEEDSGEDLLSWKREILHMLSKQPVSLTEMELQTGADRTELLRQLIKWKKQGRVREISRGYFSLS